METQQPRLNCLRPYHYQNSRARETLSQMNSSTGIICVGALKGRLQDMGFTFNDELDNKSVYHPEKLFDALALYAEKDRNIHPVRASWDAAYSATLSALALATPVQPLRSTSEIIASLKSDKFSGAPEFKKKGEVMLKELRRRDRWFSGQASQPCVALHRVQHGEKGPKTRLVWGYPQSVTLAESAFARPLIEAFKRKNSPMAIGKYRYQAGAKMTSIENSHAIYGLDMSKFDASIPRSLIDMAFRVLRKSLDLSEAEEKQWEKIRHYFIHTPILMPDGFVYTKHSGVPSGSYFTQLVDSVVNYFAIQYVWHRLTGKTIYKENILVLGDDSLFGTPQAISAKKLASVFKELNLTIHQDGKSFMTIDLNKHVHFLGHEWIYGLVDRSIDDTIKRMVYPERHQEWDDPREKIATRMYQFSSDSKSSHHIIKRWSFYDGNDVRGYYANQFFVPSKAMTGWREFQESQGNDVQASSAYHQACKAIFT